MKNPIKSRLPIFFALISYFLLPFIYQCAQTYLIVRIPSVDGLGIAGHIEWFDLIDETVEAFLVVSLYHVFNSVSGERGKLSFRIRRALWISSALYAAFSLFVYLSVTNITGFMTGGEDKLVISYLRFETLAFLAGHLAAVFIVIFVTFGRPKYVYIIAVSKTAGIMFGDFVLIPRFGVNGVAFANIAANAFLSVFCVILLLREKLPPSEKENGKWLAEWAVIGVFSGGQVFLDNVIYALVICKMVNAVSEQGNYWVANNFIWGFLLIPIFALDEIIKRENTPEAYPVYFKFLGYIILFWALSAVFWKPLLKYAMGIVDTGKILHILFTVMPFYIAYGAGMVFNSIFVSTGRTQYNAMISAIVNFGYYGVMGFIFNRGFIEPNITFICLLFGGGMLVNAVFGGILFHMSYAPLIRKGRKGR